MTLTEAQTEQELVTRLTEQELVTRLAERGEAWEIFNALAARGKPAMGALLDGLEHPDARVRAACALLLDHIADDRCIGPLLRAMQHDPREAVRRCAMHALVCDGCKECPLNTDVVGALIESARTDRSRAVRRRAVFYLSQQRFDARTGPALEALLVGESDVIVRKRAQRALAEGVQFPGG